MREYNEDRELTKVVCNACGKHLLVKNGISVFSVPKTEKAKVLICVRHVTRRWLPDLPCP